MLEELKSCNNIGDAKGLLFLVSIIRGKEEISKKEIISRCFLENNINIHPSSAVAFLEYLGLVDIKTDVIIPLPEFDNLMSDNIRIIDRIAKLSIDKLLEEGIFDENATKFNEEKGCLAIKRSAFPLTHAAIRNFLIITDIFASEGDGYIYVPIQHETELIEKIKERKKKLTLVALLKQQEEEARRGAEGEEFVLKLEKERLPEMANRIRRISDFDVTAGYDIVSYENSDSKEFDRFIEVKTYIGKPHFYWSKNESEVAERKTERYLLCLVDYSRIGDIGYQPEYIRNPYKTIFKDNAAEWFVEAEAYRIKKI